MRLFLDPPEARDEADGASRSRRVAPEAYTPEGLALGSVLAISIPVTAGLSFLVAPVVLPSTVLVAYAFWRLGRRVTAPGTMIAYCFAAGGLAGVLNSWLTLVFWTVLFDRGLFRELGSDAFGLATLIGAGLGIAFGTAYLLPMLVQLSARSLRRSEGVDRCLISFGAWGALVIGISLSVANHYFDAVTSPLDVVGVLGLASVALHTAMFVVGILRWARRRSWLSRVVQGKVPGWLVCEQQRFHASEVEGLEVFCQPLFRQKGPGDFRVLARGVATSANDAYRAVPVSPRFLIA